MADIDTGTDVKHGDQEQHLADVVSIVDRLLAASTTPDSDINQIMTDWSHTCNDHGWYAVSLLTALLGKLELSGDAVRALADDTYGTHFIE